MIDIKSTKSGALFVCGEGAKQLASLKKEIEDTLSQLDYTSLWLPSLVQDSFFHPQNVDSGHKEGTLVHAACLPFFDEVENYTDNIYFGFNRVHRLEPLRNLNKQTRMESFEVAEVIITGSKEYTATKYIEVKELLTTFLSRYTEGEWTKADDSFIQKYEKEEWIVGSGGNKVSIASANKHGEHFSAKKKVEGVSCCFGIGIERLYESINRGEG
ncbi:hypothetical protein [Rossellomorea sp. LjRoot5]|uniref:hypothetical protein n=1 Tax=Rossellomorea sp. LjRoot5 TaxID=3342331 RepID=UPI003ECFC3F2